MLGNYVGPPLTVRVYHDNIPIASISTPFSNITNALQYSLKSTTNTIGSWSGPKFFILDDQPVLNPDYNETTQLLHFTQRKGGFRSSTVGDVFMIGDEKFIYKHNKFVREN